MPTSPDGASVVERARAAADRMAAVQAAAKQAAVDASLAKSGNLAAGPAPK